MTLTMAVLADLNLLAISLLESGDLLPNLDCLSGAGLLWHQLAGHHRDSLQLLQTRRRMVVAMVAIPTSRGTQGRANGTKQNNNLNESKYEKTNNLIKFSLLPAASCRLTLVPCTSVAEP